MIRRLFPVVVLFLLTAPALAWNKPGHMVTAAIAYQILEKEDPAALARVLELLRQHPQYAEHFADKLESRPAAERDLYLFMLAARWPDDVRNNKTYHHGSWHYVDFPYKPAGQPDNVETHPPAPQNLLTAYASNLATLKGDGAAGDKAVAVCWLLHLIGDVHQPLHTVSLFTTDYPEGDRGGNLLFMRAKEGGGILNLHSYWDGLITGGQSFQNVRNIATGLRLRPEFAREKLTELAEKDVEKSASVESFELAKRVAYLDGKPLGSPKRDNSTPAVPEGYNAAAKAVAERQVVLAGYRIAEVLGEPVKR